MEETDVKLRDGEGSPAGGDRGFRIPWRGLFITLIILIVVYPLSLGPVIYFDVRASAPRFTDYAINTIYSPLYRYSQSGSLFANSYKDYLDWWIFQAL